mmetsp:Transcript_4354/g.12237  ORF Transcript_4354/g.12237 Transcript_4354/m.12237 type:complete len:353 (-) Transcript_4354:177-1235(-)
MAGHRILMAQFSGSRQAGRAHSSRLHCATPLYQQTRSSGGSSPVSACRPRSPPTRQRKQSFQLLPRRGGRAHSSSAQDSKDIVFVEEADRYYFRSLQLDSNLEGAAPSDFFELLNLELTASADDVKAAYRTLQRRIHPDIVGTQATDMAILLNKAYKVLFNDASRQAYQENVKQYRSATGGSFNGRPVSAWLGPPEETRAVFVDETTCIGCSHCSACAPETFFIESEHGRARVYQQWGNTEDEIREAVDLCPVDCIYYVPRAQVALLEWVLNGCDREDIAIMARRRSGNMGSAASKGNPFVRAEVFMKYRQITQEELGDRPMTSQDDELAGAIAHAFLQLPEAVREAAWPSS